MEEGVEKNSYLHFFECGGCEINAFLCEKVSQMFVHLLSVYWHGVANKSQGVACRKLINKNMHIMTVATHLHTLPMLRLIHSRNPEQVLLF